MKIKVLFFATLKDRARTSRAEIDVAEGINIGALKSAVAEQFPATAPSLPTCIASRNKEFAADADTLSEGDEVALFPPVSGGGPVPLPTLFKITNEVLNLDALVQAITLPTTGAACVFTGMVRGDTRRGEGHRTTYLEYEAYVPMAEAKMKQVADEIRARWPVVEGIAIVQRIGRLEPGTPTVLIACSAAHRDTGVFEAARYGIDRLKEIVPVWKREVGPNGEEWVEGRYQPTSQDKGDSV
jgi:molybdopterin converting factor subunit 1